MYARITLCCLLIVLITGCCTSSLVEHSNRKTVDTFSPVAVYQSANGDGFALEGSMQKGYADDPILRNTGSNHELPLHSYLIVNQDFSMSEHFGTNGNHALAQIKRYSPDIARHSKLERRLPLNFEKIAELPKNQLSIGIRERHRERALLVFLPFTVATDAAALPLQGFALLVMVAYVHGMRC